MLLALACFVLVPLGAVLATGTHARRRLAVIVAAGALAAPYPVRDRPWLAAMVALSAAWGLARVYELARDRRERWLRARVTHALAFVDTRRVIAVAPAVAWRQVVRVLVFLPPAVVGFCIAAASPTPGLVRWTAGVVGVYCVTEVAYAAIWAGYRATGQQLPLLHRDPVLARSVGEFWGERWNTTVGRWLRAHCFAPAVRHGRPLLGVIFAFAASAALHAYVVVVAGPLLAAAIAGFFGVQLGLVMIERALGIARWPAAVAHVWVIATLVVSSPLFVEPLLRVLGV